MFDQLSLSTAHSAEHNPVVILIELENQTKGQGWIFGKADRTNLVSSSRYRLWV